MAPEVAVAVTLTHLGSSPRATFSPGAYSDSIIVEAQCEREKFSAAVSFLSDVLTYPHFTGLKVSAANRLIGVVVQSRRRRFHI